MGSMNSNRNISPALTVGLTAVILVGVLVFLVYLFSATKNEAEVVVNGTSFEVKGMYGGTFSLKDISSIELKDTMPAVGAKTNGSGLGETMKGYFKVEGLGECLLFIDADNGPYLFITVGGKHIIMSYKDGEKTKQVYQELLDAAK